MFCSNCGHSNDSNAKFCEGCGTKLTATSNVEQEMVNERTEFNNHQPQSTTSTIQTNSQEYLEKGKVISKQYFSYVVTILKNPVRVAETMGKEGLVNGIITMVLFSLMIPLMIYLGVKNAYEDRFSEFGFGDLSDLGFGFGGMVIKPLFAFLVFFAILGLIIFGVMKLGKSEAGYLDVVSRLGAFLVVPTAFLLIALIISILGSLYFILFLSLGLVSFSFIIPLVIYSFKNKNAQGLDTFYCTLLTYIGIFILFTIIGEQAFKSILETMETIDPFGF